MLRIMLLGAVVVVLLAGVVAGGAALVGNRTGDSATTRFEATDQSASATAKGIRVEVLGATFSGTQTLLRMRATVVDRDALQAEVGSDDIQRIIPAPDGFSGDLAEGHAVTGLGPSSDLLVTLPPIVPPESYTGEVRITIAEVVVSSGSGQARLGGQWLLVLTGPAPPDLAEVLRVEKFAETRLPVGGEDVLVQGLRSTSETRVTILLPSGTRMITQPLLLLAGERVGPHGSSGDEREATASFPATPFETDVAVELGAIVAVAVDGPAPLTIDLGAALRRSPRGRDEFPIEPGDVISGPAELVLGGEQGEHGTKSWVAVVVAGAWHAEDDTPALLDADGTPLERSAVQVGYRKTVDGTVMEGTTSIAAFVDKISEVGVITVVLGGPSEIISQGERVTLQPSREMATVQALAGCRAWCFSTNSRQRRHASAEASACSS